MIQEFVSLVSIIIVILIIYWIYRFVQAFPTTDCNKFGQNQGLPACPSGTQNYGGVCYDDTWPTNFGNAGTKTAICTVHYDDCSDFTGCTHYVGVQSAPRGTPCSSATISGWDDAHFGPGWYLQYFGDLGWCQRGGTQDVYCRSAGAIGSVGVCSKGDNFEGICWGPEKCSDYGLQRTEICTCAPK